MTSEEVDTHTVYRKIRFCFYFQTFYMCHVCLRLTSERVRNVVFHFYIHKERRQSESLVLLIPQTDVVITCMVRVALYELIHNKSFMSDLFGLV